MYRQHSAYLLSHHHLIHRQDGCFGRHNHWSRRCSSLLEYHLSSLLYRRHNGQIWGHIALRPSTEISLRPVVFWNPFQKPFGSVHTDTLPLSSSSFRAFFSAQECIQLSFSEQECYWFLRLDDQRHTPFDLPKASTFSSRQSSPPPSPPSFF